ncbi:hypothetical protein B0O95_105222 [Mycetohabitans endofungorum]|uniref:Uncharacterized protein n=1 Tax=Mycetohabitans endofungorum TaxID=417203 RepID=A0A2P5KBE1_9BURK|nr:hypothetical protein B0O95_105222 [Mycetohabitans endofungorum]
MQLRIKRVWQANLQVYGVLKIWIASISSWTYLNRPCTLDSRAMTGLWFITPTGGSIRQHSIQRTFSRGRHRAVRRQSR